MASFALALFVGFGFDTVLGFVVLAGPVPLLATLAALAASMRSVSESKKPFAKIVASAPAVVTVSILLLCGVLFLAVLQGGGG